MIIRASICLSDIEKSRITISPKNGKKYLNLVLMDYKDGPRYENDGSVAHDVSKEERETGTKGAFCGNWKWLYRPEAQQRPDAPKVTAASQGVPRSQPPEDDDLPF
jgi:hypothetical protein